MSDVRVTNEGLPINNLTKDTPYKDVSVAIGETARVLREKHGIHPVQAFRIAQQRANDRIGNKIREID